MVQSANNTGKILIVDDSETIRSVLERTLGMTKLKVDSVMQAINGKDALEKLRDSPNFTPKPGKHDKSFFDRMKEFF